MTEMNTELDNVIPSDRSVERLNDRPLETPSEIKAGSFYINSDELLTGNPYSEFNDANSVIGNPDEISQDDRDAKNGFDRRGFLKSFSVAAAGATATSCVRRPEEKVVPYLKQPEGFVQGKAKYYTSVCKMCPAGCGIKVKAVEGRPVKIEGLENHPTSYGGSCALGQASIQGLYHPDRLATPMIKTKDSVKSAEWDEMWGYLALRFADAKRAAIVTEQISASQKALYETFLTKMGFDKSDLYTIDSNSLYAHKSKAHQLAFGTTNYSRYDFSQARHVVSIGSDFLASGTHKVLFAKQYSKARARVGEERCKLTMFESNMSQTGSRADFRHAVPAGSEIELALALLDVVSKSDAVKTNPTETATIAKVLKAHQASVQKGKSLVTGKANLELLAQQLLQAGGLVTCATGGDFDKNGTQLQLIEILLNKAIGAYGKTVFLDDAPFVSGLNHTDDLQKFLAASAEIDTVVVINSDPIFTVPESFGLKAIFKKMQQVVSIQYRPTSTDEYAHTLVPAHHYLESWGEQQNLHGSFSIQQPVIRPTQNSMQPEDALFWIAAHAEKPLGFKNYYAFLKAHLATKLGSEGANIELAMKKAQKTGFVGVGSSAKASAMQDVSAALSTIQSSTGGLTLKAILDPRLSDGKGSYLPALQEVGDGLTSIAWDSWLGLNPNTAKKMGLRRFDEVTVSGTGAGSLTVGVWPQPGLDPATAIIHRGNGRKVKASRVDDGIGVDPLILLAKGVDELSGTPVTTNGISVKKTGRRVRVVSMQKPTADLGNRTDIVKKVKSDAVAGLKEKRESFYSNPDFPDLFPTLPQGEHSWGLSIDLDQCFGCSACMVACAVENNVPQIGRKLVGMGREMHWIRLDIYFQGPVDSPQVTLQPMMCQQCAHAPCEAVCPVYATTHDDEGLNTQTYNRCVGTRYCANACPYKVRRFNWFTHKWNKPHAGQPPLNPRPMNPDVTVRTKGIMEKCTFCIQRIRDGKMYHKDAVTKRIPDGTVKTACQQACPSDAISFGDLQDQASEVYQKRYSGRSYLALNADLPLDKDVDLHKDHPHYGIKTIPSVNYLSHVVESVPETGHHSKNHGGKDHG